MPASSANLYHVQDSKNNFQALRPAPVCPDTNMIMGPSQNIHVSKSCYYGYHVFASPHSGITSENFDCEMVEQPHGDAKIMPPPENNSRKRRAEDSSYRENKRPREEVQIKKNIEPETTERKKLETVTEESLDHMYWMLHGGTLYQLSV